MDDENFMGQGDAPRRKKLNEGKGPPQKKIRSRGGMKGLNAGWNR